MNADSDILRLTTRFRSAIETTAKSILPIGFAKFPYGSCANASIILGSFLFDQGQGEFNLVRGSRGRMVDDTWGTHAWLTQNDLIVDITANQFAEIGEPVIVCRDSEWHNKFCIDRTSLAHFNAYDGYTCGELSRAYRAVLETLNAT